MGFKEQLGEILRKLPTENRQTLLFSATLPSSLVEFVNAGLQNPVLIRLDVEMTLCERLKLHYFQCRNEEKLAFLLYLLEFVIKADKNIPENNDGTKERISQTLIFVATKHHVEYLKCLLEEIGYNISYVYSDLDQTARKINIAKFQNKKCSIMIVTDVAARGLLEVHRQTFTQNHF
jgi:ATP-dependent RNA helicase DDX54/DBP10